MKTPIGIDKETGEIRFIQDVKKNGLACNCRCPNEACGADLVAKWCKEDRTDHFAHHRKKGGQACQEKALHLLAKHLIIYKQECYFPVKTLKSSVYYTLLGESYQGEEAFFGGSNSLTDARPEVALPEISIKPDILCRSELVGYDTRIAIEIRVTHEVDDNKLEKIISADLTSIEIDLSDLVACNEITVQKVEDTLAEKKRYKWLHIEKQAQEKLKKPLENKYKSLADKRNIEITEWHQSVVIHLQKRGVINLPAYKYPSVRINPEIEDIAGWKHKVQLPNPPNLKQQLEFISVHPITSGIMKVETVQGSNVYPLPIVFDSHENDVKTPQGSFLTLSYDQALPDPDKFEVFLQWGHSDKAERYLKKVTAEKQKVKQRKDKEVENRIRVKYRQYQNIIQTKDYPISAHIEKIARDYEISCKDLSYKGLNSLPYMIDLSDGWIFGCPQEYWQTLLLRAFCVVDNESVTVKYYAKSLKDYHGIDTVDPVKTLGFGRKALEQLKIPTDAIPTAFGVLNSYFHKLREKGLLIYAGRGQYKKSMPYGETYKRMPIYQSHHK